MIKLRTNPIEKANVQLLVILTGFAKVLDGFVIILSLGTCISNFALESSKKIAHERNQNDCHN